MRVTQRVKSVATKTGKSTSTVWRWVKAGCDISSPASINQFLKGNHRKRNGPRHHNPKPIRKPTTESVETGSRLVDEPEPDLNEIELGPVGRRGAAAALQRLEEIEERAHARLMRAIEAGNPFQVKAAQEFYLRASETLRRLDLAVETERRKGDEQVPKFLVEQIATLISAWLRISFAQFLSAESPGLMGIKDLGEFKFSAIERFRGILHATVKASIRSDPPIPDWAAAQVIEGWNIY
jgi:hypothetical protein